MRQLYRSVDQYERMFPSDPSRPWHGLGRSMPPANLLARARVSPSIARGSADLAQFALQFVDLVAQARGLFETQVA
jgi:hypothetical protein